MGDRDLGEARYRAFLSYSHKDAAAAGRLHRRLEAYRIPSRLAGRETQRGSVPARLWPIFRDREELPAATDLSETVRDALAQSGALIVLCSPHAADSLWVAEEIRVFRELHPGRPILAAILEGDPPACFPPLLRAMGDGHEPLATDLRRERDGERLGVLKLVAGITGLGLDDLMQRDATRRVRRVMAVTAGAVAAMLVMAVLVVVAWTARRDAESQRADTEELAEFMLSDLHDRLEGVGRLDIMRAVNQRALDHYNRQIERGDRSQATMLQRARVLQGLGEEDMLQGNLQAALVRFREAEGVTAAELAAAPDAMPAVRAQSQREYWLGRVHELRQDWPAARRHYGRSAELIGRLTAQAPNDPDYMLIAGGSAVGRGTVELNGARDHVTAQRLYEEAVRWFEGAVRARPQDVRAQLALANAYAWLADSFFTRPMTPGTRQARTLNQQALAARLRQYPMVERLHRADPTNVEISFRLAVAQRALARALVRAEQRDGAQTLMFEAYEGAGRLTRLDPNNADWLLFRGMMGCELYFGTAGRPASIGLPDLARDIRSVDGALRAQRNPRAIELANCVNALS